MEKLINRMSDETGSVAVDRLVFALGILSFTIAVAATLLSGTPVADVPPIAETAFL